MFKGLKERKESLKVVSKAKRDAYYARVRRLKNIVLFNDDSDLPNWEPFDLEAEITSEIWSILPDIAANGDVAYQVIVDPYAFVPAYCKLSALYELHGYPQFSALPLRTSLIQSHVAIDTKILTFHVLGRSEATMKNLTEEQKMGLWGEVFNLGHSAFRPRKQKGMVFPGLVATDGVALTVHLQTPGRIYGTTNTRKSKEALRADVQETYFQHHLDQIRAARNRVVADPNKRDILFFRDMRAGATMRYTSNQRAVETGRRAHGKKMKILKEAEGIPQLESVIPTHKTMKLNDFVWFLVSSYGQNDNFDTRRVFYASTIHRKYRWNTYVNTQRSETDLVRRMRKLYGKHFVLILGDWNDAGRTMKYQTSSKTTGWRKTFARHRIPCFLLDEYNTSKKCQCGEDVVKGFKTRPHSRPWRKARGETEKVHGLLGE